MKIDLNQIALPDKTPAVQPTGTSLSDWLQRDISLFGNKWSAKKKENLYAEMEVLLKAGLDLKTTLELVEKSQAKSKDQELIVRIRESVLVGASLFQAMEQTNRFSNFEIFSIQIAEASGNLPAILGELAAFFSRVLQYRPLLTSALSYPILVVGVAGLSLVFLLQFLVPLFGDIYARLDQELPLLTQLIISASDSMGRIFPYAIAGCLSAAGLVFYFRKKEAVRRINSLLLLKMPVFGPLLRDLFLARFAQAMAFMLSAQVPLVKALRLCRQMVSFYPIEKSLQEVEQEIHQGKGLAVSLRQHPIYPASMLSLLQVGEEAHQLENMFGKIAGQFNQEVEQRTKMLGSMIEPVLIVFLALVVGLVLVAMYLPIFKLVTNFGV